jgi:hypothetical protein
MVAPANKTARSEFTVVGRLSRGVSGFVASNQIIRYGTNTGQFYVSKNATVNETVDRDQGYTVRLTRAAAGNLNCDVKDLNASGGPTIMVGDGPGTEAVCRALEPVAPLNGAADTFDAVAFLTAEIHQKGATARRQFRRSVGGLLVALFAGVLYYTYQTTGLRAELKAAKADLEGHKVALQSVRNLNEEARKENRVLRGQRDEALEELAELKTGGARPTAPGLGVPQDLMNRWNAHVATLGLVKAYQWSPAGHPHPTFAGGSAVAYQAYGELLASFVAAEFDWLAGRGYLTRSFRRVTGDTGALDLLVELTATQFAPSAWAGAGNAGLYDVLNELDRKIKRHAGR